MSEPWKTGAVLYSDPSSNLNLWDIPPVIWHEESEHSLIVKVIAHRALAQRTIFISNRKNNLDLSKLNEKCLNSKALSKWCQGHGFRFKRHKHNVWHYSTAVWFGYVKMSCNTIKCAHQWSCDIITNLSHFTHCLGGSCRIGALNDGRIIQSCGGCYITVHAQK